MYTLFGLSFDKLRRHSRIMEEGIIIEATWGLPFDRLRDRL